MYRRRNWWLCFWTVHLSFDLECACSANLFYYGVCPDFSSLNFFLFWLISSSGNSPNFTPGHLFNFFNLNCSTEHFMNLKTQWKAGKEKWFSGKKWHPSPLKQWLFPWNWSALLQLAKPLCYCHLGKDYNVHSMSQSKGDLQIGASHLLGEHRYLHSFSLVI